MAYFSVYYRKNYPDIEFVTYVRVKYSSIIYSSGKYLLLSSG